MKYLILSFLMFATPAFASNYDVNMDNSQITFIGTHAGKEFNGEFATWDADIVFDKDNLDASLVTVTFNTASAKTGNAMYDGTLPTADWFDAKNHPVAAFTSKKFEITDNGFSTTGDLTIKDVTKPISFDFTLKGDAPIHMHASFPVSRMDFNIGTKSDPNAEWVSKDIQIDIRLEAVPTVIK